MKTIRLFSFALLGAFALSLAACADDPQIFPYGQLSPVPPPEAPFEATPQLASPSTEIWKPGHWNYNGLDFFWVSGTVVSRPSNTAVWSADRWEQRGYGWAYVPGYWQ
jgi:hypothetical protein